MGRTQKSLTRQDAVLLFNFRSFGWRIHVFKVQVLLAIGPRPNGTLKHRSSRFQLSKGQGGADKDSSLGDFLFGW
jgi:hypothetical protein